MVQQKEPNSPNSYDKQVVTLGRVLQVLREEENPDVLVDTVINYLHTELEYCLIWVGLYDRLEHRVFGRGGITPTGETAILKQRFTLNPGDVLEQVVIQQRPLAVPDLRAELRAGEWRKAAQKFDIQGTVIFPIRYRDRCYGVALLGTPHWGVSPKSDEKARLSMILGEYAAALYKIETEWQRQQVKPLDEPLLLLLSRLRSLAGLGNRLEAVVEETQQFVLPTRTSVYWYERERRYFWRRIGNRQRAGGFGEVNQASSGITLHEVGGFYQALATDQVVAIGEAHSSLKADTTSRLMQQIRARSLLAAPILFQGELLGFLAVEGQDARIWTEGEKNFVRGAAQMIALMSPLDEMETTIEQIRLDQELTAEIARSIYDEDDWKSTLKQTADRMCKRLKAERFLVLLYDKDLNLFEISYQSHPNNRRPLMPPLEALNESDRLLLQKSDEAVAIENLDGDLKLVAWRDRLLELGVRSLILCNTSIGHELEGLIMICHEAPRTWNRVERELVRVVGQQIGFILHQWQLQRQTEQFQKISQATQEGLKAMQQTHELVQLERASLQHIAQVLQAPLAVLVSWLPGQTSGRVVSSPSPNDRFAANIDATIPLSTDLLVRWALENQESLPLAIQEIPATSRHWLYGAGIGQILIATLRTAPDHQPTGIVVVVDEAKRRWAERYLMAFSTLVNQFAWAHRYLTLTSRLTAQRLELERLNWYKHRRLEEAHRSLATGLKRLDELDPPKEPLLATRQQQLLRQLKDTIAPLTHVIDDEQWKLRTYPTTISLITLLKRSLERVDEVFKQRQLWLQVHNETNLTLSGDIIKIELVLYELLLVSSQRCSPGGRIDIWCRQIDSRWLELSITDNGQIEARLMNELESGQTDWLTPSLLEHPPGLHLLVCQSLMKQLGGEFNLYKLEDGRITSRVVLRLASGSATR